jgi:hypothetical protein
MLGVSGVLASCHGRLRMALPAPAGGTSPSADQAPRVGGLDAPAWSSQVNFTYLELFVIGLRWVRDTV